MFTPDPESSSSPRRFPAPPHGQSIGPDGKLKDTPANRALRPVTASAETFDAASNLRSVSYADSRSILLNGDVEARLQDLIDVGLKVDTIVTSPPYYGQRDYGVDGQIGLEEHPQEFIDRLANVFDLCGELLSDTGSMWINIGDTYWSGKGAHKSAEVKQGARRFGLRPQDRPGDGQWTKPKQLLLVPHRLAIALQDRGWLVRNDNVWVKPNPVPDQVRDRCSTSHEYVFHLTRNRWYYFDQAPVGRMQPSGRILPPLDTWTVKTSSGGGSHRASFSEDLVRIPILSTTPPGGVVLDPFNGSGTSMLFARRAGFRSVGIDLSDEYCATAAAALKELDADEVLGVRRGE
ncbi:site-specific DNA-methyltransferase [Cellulomonas sp. URHE0023]|uniref:DNA-methyltransferase n=1 Tax=Cellulomonas sp. URHE0023 TaxID=1380354 RepID=UPI0009DE79B6|nr:site-specific DNA-methyltransferase [Cellulomonas sp. URHE0023]